MKDDIDIQRIAGDSPHVATLAAWEFREWGHHHPGRSLEAATAAFRGGCGEGGVPSVFAALRDDMPVGMASLLAHDMDDRRDLGPWVASVYVLGEWRGRGIASRLVRRVEREARDHGFDAVFLFTPDQQSLYRRLGWQDLERCGYHGEEVTIMWRGFARRLTPDRSDPRS